MKSLREARFVRVSAVAASTAAILAIVLSIAWSSPALGLSTLAPRPQAQPTVATGFGVSAAVKADGSLWTWGYANAFVDAPGLLTPTRVGNENVWTGVSVGGLHVMGLKDDRSLWGVSDSGDTEEAGWADVIGRIGKDSDWAIVCESPLRPSLALKDDGSLWSLDFDLQSIVEGTWDDSDGEPYLIERVGAESDWATLAGCGAYFFAIKDDGSLWSLFVYEEDAEPDDPMSMRSIVSCEIERIGTDNDWASVAGGPAAAAAIKTDGTLWLVEYWADDQIDPQTGETIEGVKQTITQIGTDNDWLIAATSGTHTLAIKTAGTLWSWGLNSSGEIGDGSIQNREFPIQIGNANTWRAVSAYYGCSLAVRADGTLWAWGDNTFGQLGDGTTTERHTPVKVMNDVMVPAWPGNTGSTGRFSDLESSPYKEAILVLAARGIVGGFEDGTFRPGDPVTRQQFAKIIVKTLSLPVTGSETCPFTDVAVHVGDDPLYPSKYVAVCAQEGITQGKTALTFSPESTMTREQLITMAVRAAALPDPPADYAPGFASSQFSLEEHYRNARKAAYAGLLNGLQGLGQSYAFGAPALRGECALVLYRMLLLLDNG